MNKHGLTLIEILVAVIIIAILASIGIISYTVFIDKASNQNFEKYMDSMHAETITYVAKNLDEINWENNTAHITLSELNMDPINNPKDANDLCINNSYVDVVKERNANSGVLSMTYTVCLQCNDFAKCQEYEN